MKLFLSIAFAALPCVACSKDQAAPTAELRKSDLPESVWLEKAPADAKGVLAARDASKPGERVAIEGRVSDFVKGLAVFRLTDFSLKACDEEGPMPSCETPWDYCCTDPRDVAAASAMVIFREGDQPRMTEARGFHGLDYLAKATVTGKLEKDDQGNLTVIADGVHVSR